MKPASMSRPSSRGPSQLQVVMQVRAPGERRTRAAGAAFGYATKGGEGGGFPGMSFHGPGDGVVVAHSVGRYRRAERGPVAYPVL
jgi:hypothetical protein